MRVLSIAATGMAAQQLNVEVIANNIANINTTGFKRSRAEFTDLIYQSERLQGVSSRGQDSTVPEGAQLGLGVRTSAIRSLTTQGTLTSTGNQLDLALSGRGWFQITGPSGDTLYTRAGSFNTNATGQIVTADGYLLQPAMPVPTNATSVTVSQSGKVTVTIPGQTAAQTVGQITLANFPNEAGLMHLGGNLYQQTDASGTATAGVPGDPGFATVNQGYLEASNVDPVKEISDLISAQRAYEMNSKVITAADQMEQTVSKNMGS
jgi:flagellar basal-body rod protein FlgG